MRTSLQSARSNSEGRMAGCIWAAFDRQRSMGSLTARISRKVDPLAVYGRILTSKTPVETLLNNLFDSVFIGTVEQPDALAACL